jgi:hypothetical protein
MRWEGLFGVRQSPNRLFFIGPHCDCGPRSAEVSRGGRGRCGQNRRALQAGHRKLSSDQSRENPEEPTTRAMPSYEVIVVGLGAVGSAATWHLARLGTKVLGIDRYRPPHEFGSSTGETRLTRAAVGEGVEYSPLALRSNEIWREIEITTGQALFVQCGCLTITGHPNKSMVHGVNRC